VKLVASTTSMKFCGGPTGALSVVFPPAVAVRSKTVVVEPV
jgi:hypothetical protein